ncbi:cell wall surface anchor family protein, putative [Burkholderia pseudomallei 1710b]|uniref:Cell wall surface anchor family protein, putative n=1 Tax=Burkholderia pseudomallei (strain 1710b) TaxID=320372 RepID=Q3JY38_BURP1|nr:cell wall surface anchor family protein, putative [Burkholderia pseudomallei 1710b]
MRRAHDQPFCAATSASISATVLQLPSAWPLSSTPKQSSASAIVDTIASESQLCSPSASAGVTSLASISKISARPS